LAEEAAALRQRAATRAIGEQTKVPNAHKSSRHDVQEKPPQEFVGLQRQDFHAVVVGVVLPPEPDRTVAERDEAIVR